MKYHIIYSGIIIVLAIALFRTECSKSEAIKSEVKIDGKRYDVINKETDTVFIKVKPDVIYKSGKNVYRDTTIYRDVPSFGLSNAGAEAIQEYYDSILMSHFATNVYTDTIKFGKYGSLYITDSIQENKILSRSSNSDLMFPSVTHTTIVKDKPKNQLYLGARGIFVNGTVSGVGTGVILKSKKDRLYGFGAVIDRQKNINFALDFYIKL